jgi:hypothetical protein
MQSPWLSALLASPEFQVLLKASPYEVEERIQALRNEWNDHWCTEPIGIHPHRPVRMGYSSIRRSDYVLS